LLERSAACRHIYFEASRAGHRALANLSTGQGGFRNLRDAAGRTGNETSAINFDVNAIAAGLTHNFGAALRYR